MTSLSENEELVAYNLIREEFDRTAPDNYPMTETLITLAKKLGLNDLAQQMTKDAAFGKNNIPQPPSTRIAISREEWLHKIEVQTSQLPSRP